MLPASSITAPKAITLRRSPMSTIQIGVDLAKSVFEIAC